MRYIVIVVLLVLLYPIVAESYKENTHINITMNSVSNSNLPQYLSNQLGLRLSDEFRYDIFSKKSIAKWIQDGSFKEDNPPRWVNHFYDFVSHSGLKSIGLPSLSWGKDGLVNTWSWSSARYYFFTALTTTDEFEREKNYAMTFRSVAQVMHLVEDLAVPSHVRNDMHIPVPSWLNQTDLYEKYTEERVTNRSGTSLTFTGYPAINLSTVNDFDKFWTNTGKGLSEFTGSNFLSRDTNFDSSGYSDYNLPPNPSTTVVLTENKTDAYGVPHAVEVAYVSGNVVDAYRGTTEPIQRMSAFSLFNYETQKLDENRKVYTLNDSIHQEYANFLLPRAVGYAAGLLDYFFRGKIELSLPGSGVYSVALAGGSFTELHVNAENVMETDEEMSDGSIQLAVKYKVANTDPFQGVQADVDPEYHYIVAQEKNGARTIPKKSTTELVFDLTSTPIPKWAVDVKINIIYKGKLGVETDAVAVGFKDISEPTPVDVFNNTDYTCVSEQWYQSGSLELFQIKYTTDSYLYGIRDMFPHDIANIAFWVRSPDNTVLTSAPALAPNGMRRLGYILTDSTFTYGFSKDWVHTDPYDYWTNLYLPVTPHSGTAVVNADGSYPVMYSMRDKPMWWGASVIFDNNGYRNGWAGAVDASCSWDDMP